MAYGQQYGSQWASLSAILSVPSFVISPSSGFASQTTSVLATGSHTFWTSSTTFSISGSGNSILSQSVNQSAQTATLTILAGSTLGGFTVSENADGATAVFTVNSPPPPPPPPPPIIVSSRQFCDTGRSKGKFNSKGRDSGEFETAARSSSTFKATGDDGK